MEKVKSIKEVKIQKGDYYSRQITRDGIPYKVIVIPKSVVEQVKDCCFQYTQDHCHEQKPIGDENVDWLLGLICHGALEEQGIKVYEITEEKKDAK